MLNALRLRITHFKEKPFLNCGGAEVLLIGHEMDGGPFGAHAMLQNRN
jgi:hypothetical protein